jgi:hypothetical protein
MVTFVATVTAMTVAMVFLIAAGEHARFPRVLAHALQAHGVLPGPLVRPVAVTVIAAEAVAGGLTAFGAVAGQHHVIRLGLVASALLAAGYGSYSQKAQRHARTTGAMVPCGCSQLDTPLNGWVVARAYLLAGLAAIGAVAADRGLVPSGSAMQFGIAATASTAFAVVLWRLPHAMRMPLGLEGSHD